MGEERLQKLLAHWGLASRRAAEGAIAAGRVRVNGQVAHLGQRADPRRDRIELDGRPLSLDDRPPALYLLLHKPARVLSTCQDDRDRPGVLDLLPVELVHGTGLHPVGRLDWNSTGALLLTNDGALTLALTHPRFHLPKCYEVWVAGQPNPAVLERWRQGVLLDDRPTLPAQVRVLARRGSERTLLEVELCEGRNRQIRRTAELLGHPVLALHRRAIGPLQLDRPPLAQGEFRFLLPQEIRALGHRIP